jgi:hypothetical protein
MPKMTFEEWMRQVDAALGMDHRDLPDYCYKDAFEDGDSPKQAARAAMRAAME